MPNLSFGVRPIIRRCYEPYAEAAIEVRVSEPTEIAWVGAENKPVDNHRRLLQLSESLDHSAFTATESMMSLL